MRKTRLVLKKIIVIFLVGFLGISVISFYGNLIKRTFVEFFYPEPTIMLTSTSPDGKYTAYVFESNGGATSGWVYHISILPAHKKLGKGPGNVYVSDMRPEKIEWKDNKVLYVKDYQNIGTTKREEKLRGINIEFYSLSVSKGD